MGAQDDVSRRRAAIDVERVEQVAGERRLYALTGTNLVYVQELALLPGDYRPHLSASLARC